MKVVINRCYGGFGISEEAQKHLGIGVFQYDAYRHGNKRNAPELIETVKALGAAANGRFAELIIVDIPDGTDYQVLDFDGFECIVDRQRLWPKGDRNEDAL